MTRTPIPAPITAAATAMLSQFCPGLTAGQLETMLASCHPDNSAPAITKPLTRKEAAALLSCSIQTIYRYMTDGTLRFVKIGKRAVRIDPASVRALIENGIPRESAAPAAEAEQ